VLVHIEEQLDEGGKISLNVTNSVELALVVLYNIVSAFVCMVQVGQLVRDIG
jgi:hypothetical protein